MDYEDREDAEKKKQKKSHPHPDLHRDPWLSPTTIGVQRVTITLYGFGFFEHFLSVWDI